MTKIGTAVSIILCWLWLALAAMPVAAQPSDTQRRWEMLNTEIVQAYRSGDFAEGIGKAEQALALAHDAFGPRHPDTLQSMNNLGRPVRQPGPHQRGGAAAAARRCS